jgi:xanthine dehydrogenase molybdenum-binding subunit
MSQTEFRLLGQDFPRKAGAARVTGRELYPSDLTLPGMLHGTILRSPHPHARVKGIDFSGALALGASVLGPWDVPEKRFNVRQVSVPRSTYKDWQVLSDHVRQVGDPFAAVAAETEELALRAAEAVKVEWELLPAYLSVQDALAAQGPLIHDRVWVEDREIAITGNIACTREVAEGDVARGFEQAEVIIENEFSTPRAYHAQLEPRACLCRPEPDGGLTVWPSTQALHNTRILIGEIFSLPLNKVNVVQVPGGGHFGSGIHTNPVTLICAALALKACRPVRIVHSREEDLYDHCRYQTRVSLRLGAKRDGTLTAGEMKAEVDIGCHHIQALAFLGVLAGWWHSLYRLPNMRYTGLAVYTNKAPSCAMQGYGAPQVHFFVESAMGMLAEKLGLDPLELRLKNYVGLGEIFWGQGPTVRSLIHSDGVKELLAEGSKRIGWERRRPSGSARGRYRRGIGMARGFHTSGTGAPVPGEVKDYSTALVKVNEDGSIDLLTALMDHGGGSLDAAAKLVAEEFGVPFDRVGVSPADTRSTGYDVCTHATRGVYCGGGAALEAAREAKKVLLEFASRLLNAPVGALRIEPDPARGQGLVTVVGMPEKRLSLAEVATAAMNNDWGTAIAVKSVRMTNCPPAYTAFFVEVEVDTETGQVRILHVVAGSDAGTVINPALARGQLTGGFYRGASMALLEDTGYEPESGRLTNQGLLFDYKMLGIAEMPEPERFETFFASTYEPTGPMGAKGIGEAALNPVPAAVAAAIQNATGVWFRKLPILPEDIVAALRNSAPNVERNSARMTRERNSAPNVQAREEGRHKREVRHV